MTATRTVALTVPQIEHLLELVHLGAGLRGGRLMRAEIRALLLAALEQA